MTHATTEELPIIAAARALGIPPRSLFRAVGRGKVPSRKFDWVKGKKRAVPAPGPPERRLDAGERRSSGVEAQMVEDALRNRGVGDEGDKPEPAATGAGEDVQGDDLPEQLGHGTR